MGWFIFGPVFLPFCLFSVMTKRRQNKTSTLASAIRECVHDGDRVAIGLCLESLIPFAAGHELIRQGEKRSLTDRSNL
jgi:hypothetical protein